MSSQASRSREEEDTLQRSTKKIKDGHTPDPSTSNPLAHLNVSYKGKLIGQLPGAYETAFNLHDHMQEDADSDVDEEDLCAGYQYLSQRVRELWKPTGNMDLVDLGYDYFLARFWTKEDLDNVLKGGPWFIGQHFLAIKPWEPEFSASAADPSQVAVWIRLPGLPIEFYELEVLKKIGSAIGPVLRIDSHTAANARGRYARMCVQVRIDKPLITTVLIGKFTQKVMYEGLQSLCFACGRVGHKKESCQYTIKPLSSAQTTQTPTQTTPSPNDPVDNGSSKQEPSGSTPPKNSDPPESFGPWLLVSRKK
ncbi:hypothetical protein SO802_002370 [Lithocarpus litseifolius]|uniref:CCHC-type domain-containing protein n=1 Tax=Lithocarpus litseifolius TaxID=425828 RepID=A0AAW2E2E0_9ROSI